jgi:hypothetical protein
MAHGTKRQSVLIKKEGNSIFKALRLALCDIPMPSGRIG